MAETRKPQLMSEFYRLISIPIETKEGRMQNGLTRRRGGQRLRESRKIMVNCFRSRILLNGSIT